MTSFWTTLLAIIDNAISDAADTSLSFKVPLRSSQAFLIENIGLAWDASMSGSCLHVISRARRRWMIKSGIFLRVALVTRAMIWKLSFCRVVKTSIPPFNTHEDSLYSIFEKAQCRVRHKFTHQYKIFSKMLSSTAKVFIYCCILAKPWCRARSLLVLLRRHRPFHYGVSFEWWGFHLMKLPPWLSIIK